MSKRIRVIYRGHVQGVGFRFNACQIAGGMQVAGFVRNDLDGSVTLEVQAGRATLDAFLQAIRDSRVGPFIRNEAIETLPLADATDGFSILR